MTCVEWLITWTMFEIACVPALMLLGRAMWQNGDGSKSQNDDEPV